jgi:rhodanese-related sulfurtransferase
MVAATLIGVAQNAVRSNPLNLFPKVQTPRPTPPSPVNPATDAAPAAEPGLAGAVTPLEVTADEIARGELSKERLRLVMDAGTAIIIDARGESEYAAGHVRGALNIPYESFTEHYKELEEYVPMDATVICYCQSLTCDLSDRLAQELRLMGYEKVVLFRGGWQEWSEAGFPSEAGESTLEHEE